MLRGEQAYGGSIVIKFRLADMVRCPRLLVKLPMTVASELSVSMFSSTARLMSPDPVYLLAVLKQTEHSKHQFL
jgi:hypothetical protein